jgi:molecular chaperone Hsp33
MIKKDTIHRFIFENAPVRGEFIRLHDCYQTIINQHDYPAPIRKLLGEALCVAGLLAAIIKFTGRLTVQYRGKGKLKFLLVQCDNHFDMRALVKCDGELSYEDLMNEFNNGILVIMLDTGAKGNRYQGIVNWEGNSLVKSIEAYFKKSEQLATKIWLSVDETTAAGLLLQVVPTADKDINLIESEIIAPLWDHLTKEASKATPESLLQTDYQTLLTSIFAEEEIRDFPAKNVQFKCACTRKRGEDAIAILGKEEAEAEIKDKQTIVVTCDFCNTEYMFDKVDVAAIFQKKDPSPPDTLH